MRYLITGATGHVGNELIGILAEDGHDVRALTRTGDAGPWPPAVKAVKGDLDDPPSLAGPLNGVDGLFLLPGYRDMPGIVNEAKRAGVHRIVLLSGGSAGSGDLTNAVTAYMVRSEEAVRGSALAWTILRPTAFMSNALRWKDKLATGTARLPFAGVRTACIDPFDIASVAAVALEGGHDGETHVSTGPESLLPAEQVAILGDVLGRDFRFEAQPDDEARAEMSGSMPAEYVDAFFDFYAAGSLDESVVRPTVEQFTGRPPRSFRQWAQRHVSDFG